MKWCPRHIGRANNHTFVEFDHEKETLFDHWCQSKNVDDFDKLRDLILLEEFKNCLPDKDTEYCYLH